MKLIEQFFGNGDVLSKDENLGSVNNKLYVYQEIHNVKDEEIEGLKTIIGQIDSKDAMRLFDKNNLKLVLEDGRSIEFFVRNTDGEIRCSGNFIEKSS